MVQELNKTTILTGTSKKQYKFNLWGFDDFDDVKGTFQGGGLCIFTKRELVNSAYMHTCLYLGKTTGCLTRYDNRHNETFESNCIGFHSMPNTTEEDMEKTGKDILSNYDFPCNTINY